MLVALEGLEGAGKTTLGMMVSERLAALYVKSPPTELNPSREYVSQVRSPLCSFYFYLSGLYALQERLGDARTNNKLVLIDRYLLSTIAYHDYGNSFSPPVSDLGSLIKPDFSIHVRCSSQIRALRIANRGHHIFERQPANEAAIEEYFSERCEVDFWNSDGLDDSVDGLSKLLRERLGQDI